MAGFPKLTGFLIGMVLIGLFAGLFGIVLTQFGQSYDQDYDDSVLAEYAEGVEETDIVAEGIKNQTTSITGDTSFGDLLGSFFGQGYKAVKASFGSINVFTKLSDNIYDDLGLTDGADLLKTAIGTIVFILFFVGIIVAVIVKREIL